MNKIEIKNINPSLLRNATLLCNGSGFMRTYNLNNGFIYKEIKEKDSSSLNHFLNYDDFVDCLEGKLKISKELSSEHVILPKTIYMNKDRLVGYTMPFISFECFDSIMYKMNNLDDITNMFILLSCAVKEENKNGIIFPDLGNASNIYYDNKNKKIKFIDYDGLQVGDYDSFNVSILMSKYSNPVFEDKKYFDKCTTLYTSNFDKASLLALYLFYTSRTNITKFEGNDFDIIDNKFCLKKKALFEYLYSIGLLDSPILEDFCLIYNNEKNNNYIETSIKRLNKSYNLDFRSHVFKKK